VFKAFKYSIAPTEEQKILLNKHFGCTRFVYNLALETKQMAYAGAKVNLTCFDFNKQLCDLKEIAPYLKEVNSQSLQMAFRNLDSAYTKFFKWQSDFPKFKTKGSADSFQCPQNVVIKGGKIYLPKFKKGIDIVLHREYKGAIKTVTISKTTTGKYFASVLCDTGEAIKKPAKIKEQTTIGIDLGIKTFLVTSDGRQIDNHKFLRKAQSRLKFTQSKYSKHKGKRTKHRLAILHEKVANQRKDFLHKTSTKLIRENQSVAIEDLQIKNMVKNHHLAQSISDAGWGTFVTMLEYKAEWYGKNILRIGKFEPSSKTCSCCGSINKELTLQDREWTCKGCGTLLNRDVNAAINIKSFALRNHLSKEVRHKNQNELPTLVGVMTSETVARKGGASHLLTNNN